MLGGLFLAAYAIAFSTLLPMATGFTSLQEIVG